MDSSYHITSTLTWRDWSIYVVFVVSYVGLSLLAVELHWHLPVVCQDLTLTNNGQSVVALISAGESGYRHYLTLFDTNLSQQRKIRLSSDLPLTRCAVAEDGQSFAIALRSKHGPLFELRSLEDPATILNSLHVSLVNSDYGYWIDEFALIGNPVSFIAMKQDGQLKVFNLSGEPIANIKDVKELENHPFVIQAQQAGTVQSAQGRTVTQQLDHLQMIDQPIDGSASHTKYIPSHHLQGKLSMISPHGQTLLFDNDQELTLVSANDGTVLERLPIPPPYNPRSAKIMSDDVVIYDRSKIDYAGSTLVAFNWKKSAVKEVGLDSLKPLPLFIAHCASLVLLISWGGVFLYAAVKRQNHLFGSIILFAMLSLLMQWLYLHSGLDNFQEDLREGIGLFVTWQIVLSLVCVLTFRYLPIIVASGVTLCLAADIFFTIRMRYGSNHLWAGNAFLIAGVGLVIAFLFIAVAEGKERKLTLTHLLLLTSAIAFAARLFSASDSIVLMNTVDWPPYLNTHWPQAIGVTAGIFQVLFTALACYFARLKSIWLFVAPVILFVVLVSLIAFPHSIGKRDSEVWIILITMAGSLVTLLLLHIYYLGFERLK